MEKSYSYSKALSGLNLINVFLLLSCVMNVGIVSAQLSPNFYDNTCPLALSTIKASVDAAVALEPRMGASLLRLHFHDCFVRGCDASILLDDTVTFTGEKTATQNINSVRGFDVIDAIKSAVEAVCPGVVSCADIVAVAARDSVVALGGPSWLVQLGRRDSITASLSLANSDLPSPSLNIGDLLTLFSNKGFSPQELVALSGAHTIGKARCVNFRTRTYTESNIDALFAATLQLTCPILGGDDILSNLDTTLLDVFDNSYYTNLVNKKGLLHSDQQLFNGGPTDAQVTIYSNDATTFSFDFGNAMIKLGNLSPLTGSDGQVRLNCRKVN